MKKIGAFAGKFLPPHIGHLKQIEQCAALCDELRVVVAENPETCQKLTAQSNLKPLPASLRIKWLEHYFKNNKKIKIYYMDETGLDSFPADMDKWAKRFNEVVGNDVNMKFADETYRELNEKYFPNCQFVAFDRTVIPISATMIRQNPKKYQHYLIPEIKNYLLGD